MIPVIILIALMLQGRTPETSAFWAIASLSILFVFSTPKISEMKERGVRLIKGMDAVGRSLIKVVPLLICANIIVSLITLTGIGVNISEIIMSLSGSHVYLALALPPQWPCCSAWEFPLLRHIFWPQLSWHHPL